MLQVVSIEGDQVDDAAAAYSGERAATDNGTVHCV